MISTIESIIAAQDYCNTCQIDKDYKITSKLIYNTEIAINNIDTRRNLIRKTEWLMKKLKMALNDIERNKRNIESWKAKDRLFREYNFSHLDKYCSDFKTRYECT